MNIKGIALVLTTTLIAGTGFIGCAKKEEPAKAPQTASPQEGSQPSLPAKAPAVVEEPAHPAQNSSQNAPQKPEVGSPEVASPKVASPKVASMDGTYVYEQNGMSITYIFHSNGTATFKTDSEVLSCPGTGDRFGVI